MPITSQKHIEEVNLFYSKLSILCYVHQKIDRLNKINTMSYTEHPMSRIIVGLSLTSVAILTIWMRLVILPQIITTIAICYDLYSSRKIIGMYQSHVLLEAYGIYCHICNIMLFDIYQKNFNDVVKILIVSQLGDILQYVTGKKYGKNYVGWISPNKTYEGYLGGLILTLLIVAPFYEIYTIIAIYMQSIIGGLLSSYIKRSYAIKDYSCVLGSHGGWLDRSDSIYFPIIIKFLCLWI